MALDTRDTASDAGSDTGSDTAAETSSDVLSVTVDPQPRRLRFVAQWPIGLVVATIAVGLVVIAMHHFRWGSLAVALGVVGGGLLRLVLPARQAGMLAVRSRMIDVTMMLAAGVVLWALALVTKT